MRPSKVGSVASYERYSRPYDKRVLAALADTKLTLLHLHTLERPYLEQFKDFSAPVINSSVKTSGIPVAEVRKVYSQAIAGGVDEVDFDKLTTERSGSSGHWRGSRRVANTSLRRVAQFRMPLRKRS